MYTVSPAFSCVTCGSAGPSFAATEASQADSFPSQLSRSGSKFGARSEPTGAFVLACAMSAGASASRCCISGWGSKLRRRFSKPPLGENEAAGPPPAASASTFRALAAVFGSTRFGAEIVAGNVASARWQSPRVGSFKFVSRIYFCTTIAAASNGTLGVAGGTVPRDSAKTAHRNCTAILQRPIPSM